MAPVLVDMTEEANNVLMMDQDQEDQEDQARHRMFFPAVIVGDPALRKDSGAASWKEQPQPPNLVESDDSISPSQTQLLLENQIHNLNAHSHGQPAAVSASRQISPPPLPDRRGMTMQTPSKRSDWTADQIAAKLTTFVDDVGQGHARLVEFMLEEAERKAPQRRYICPTDHFADMKSTLMDPTAAPDPDIETMAVKFKESFSFFFSFGALLR